MAQFVGILLPLVACPVLSAQNPSAQKEDHRVRNIVLVHGAQFLGDDYHGSVANKTKLDAGCRKRSDN
jgi:hypothetical protein